MVFVRMLSKLLRDPEIGKLVVPIVPDEARTFGMEALFRQVGIYSHAGQVYEPVDMDTLLYYKEACDGQILEEGINEAGSMSSFIASTNAGGNDANVKGDGIPTPASSTARVTKPSTRRYVVAASSSDAAVKSILDR